MLIRLGGLAQSRTWCGSPFEPAILADEIGKRDQKRLRQVRLQHTKKQSFFGEFQADSGKRVLFDRFLSLNVRTRKLVSRGHSRQRERISTSVSSAVDRGTNSISQSQTENRRGILSRPPRVSSKKILETKFSRNWQRNTDLEGQRILCCENLVGRWKIFEIGHDQRHDSQSQHPTHDENSVDQIDSDKLDRRFTGLAETLARTSLHCVRS